MINYLDNPFKIHPLSMIIPMLMNVENPFDLSDTVRGLLEDWHTLPECIGVRGFSPPLPWSMVLDDEEEPFPTSLSPLTTLFDLEKLPQQYSPRFDELLMRCLTGNIQAIINSQPGST